MAKGETAGNGNARSEADRIRARGGVIECTIQDGNSLATEILQLRGRRVFAIEMPDAWTAATISFLSGSDEAGLHPVFDDNGNEILVTVAADQIVAVTGAKADALMALDLLQIRSGTAAAPVAQVGADRLIKILLK